MARVPIISGNGQLRILNAGVWDLFAPAPPGCDPGYAVWADGEGHIILWDWNGGAPWRFLHYTYGAGWSVVNDPSFPAFSSTPRDFWGVNYNNVWCAGGNGWIGYWNGIAWNWLYQEPAGHDLKGVWASSASDIWAVGNVNSGIGNCHILHYNGVGWSDLYAQLVADVAPADPGRPDDIIGFAANDVWIACGLAGGGPNALVVHWDGANFSIQNTFGGSSNRYPHVWGTDNNHIWFSAQKTGGGDLIIWYWNGAAWVNQTTTGWSGFQLHGIDNQAVYHTLQAWPTNINLLETLNGGTLWSDIGCPNLEWRGIASYGYATTDYSALGQTFNINGLIDHSSLGHTFTLGQLNIQFPSIHGHCINIENIQVVDIPKLDNVWDQFDEHGLLVGIERNRGETNWSFKRRILDAFVHRANSSYQGLVHAITRDLGLSLFQPIYINPKLAHTDGEFFPPDPYIKFDNAYLYLYSDYRNDILDCRIDRHEVGGNYEHLQSLVNFINTTTYFTANLTSFNYLFTHSMTILNQSNRQNFQEGVQQSTCFKLQHPYIVKGSVYFERDSATYLNEVADIAMVDQPGTYYIDYTQARITTYSMPALETVIRYQYSEYPFQPWASPIIITDINDVDFTSKLFDQILQDNGLYTNGKLTTLGVSIVNELLSVVPMYWGV